MRSTSHPVKGADGGDGAVPGEVDINGGGIEGLMSKEGLDGEEVDAVFVEVGAEGVAEGMAGEPSGPAEAVLMGMDVPGEEEGVDRPVLPVLLWEKITHRPSAGKPVLSEDVQSGFREDGIAVGAVFAMSDVDAHVFPLDILIAEGTDLADTQAGGIQKSDHGFLL